MIYIILIVAIAILWFLFNPTANRIRSIQSLLNKDRSVSDVINSIDGWKISPIDGDGIKMLINSPLGIYALYITYKGERPDNDKIKELYEELTDENSIVTKAHMANMPVEAYMQDMTREFEEIFRNINK